MATRRFIASFRRGAWWYIGWPLLLGLAACGAADQRVASQPSLMPSANLQPSVAPTTEIIGRVAIPTTEPAATSAPNVAMQPISTPEVRIIHGTTLEATTTATVTTWQTYHSARGGYTIEYPAGWSMTEQAGANGAVATTFTASNGGTAIVVAVYPTDPAQQAPLDLPNTRCQPLPGNRGIATHCLDTIARTSTTTFVGQNRTYTITMAGKGMDENIYQRMLNSFAPDAPAAGQNQARHQLQNDLAPLLLQHGDLPDTVVGEPTDDPSPPNFANDPPATTMAGRRLTRAGRGVGSVSLLFYDNPSDLTQAYERLTTDADSFNPQGNAMEPRSDVGDKAMMARLTLASSTYGPTHTVVVIFARCHSIIDLRLNEQDDLTLDTAVAYAKHLDGRITAVVCQ